MHLRESTMKATSLSDAESKALRDSVGDLEPSTGAGAQRSKSRWHPPQHRLSLKLREALYDAPYDAPSARPTVRLTY